MSHDNKLSISAENTEVDLYTVIRFLNEKFGATCYSHQYPKNIISLEGRRWWVAISAVEDEFEINVDGATAKSDVIKKLNDFDAGLLIFRKAEKNYMFAVYMIENIDALGEGSTDKLIINWNELSLQNLIYEKGIVIGDEVIGFKKLRRSRTDIHSKQ